MTGEAFRIKLAKWIDEFVGTPAVHLARFFRRRARSAEPVRKALFIKFWGIGSIVLAEPALRRLKERHPDVEVHFLTLERNRQLFSMIPAVDRVHCVSFGSLGGFASGSLKTARSLRAERFDAVFDAEFFVNCSGLLAWALTPRRIVGFARPDGAKRHLQDVSVPFLERAHTVRQFLNLVEQRTVRDRTPAAGGKTEPRPSEQRLMVHGRSSTGACVLTNAAPTLSIPASRWLPLALPAARTIPYVLINVNASPLALERRWSGEGFAVLGRALLKNFDVDLVLIGSAAERNYVESVAQRIGAGARVRNLAGTLDLIQLARLIESALMVVSNDSGPIHMASAFDVPTVGFYGPETPLRYGPLSSRRLVFYENLPCSPCMSVENAKTVRCVNDRACMRSIDADRATRETVAFLRSLLEERDAAVAAQTGVR